MNNNEQIISLTRDLNLIRERYLNLVNIHGELQKQNSILEERILSIVETYSNEKTELEDNLLHSKQQILHLQDTVNDLEIEKQRYKDDCNLAVSLLHQHPEDFLPTTEQLKTKNEQITTSQSQHSIIMPTFPPMFATPLPLLSTTISSTPTSIVNNDNLRLAESLFKSNTVHRYPSTHFICSNCHQTIKCCDVSVQTSLDNHDPTFRKRLGSLTPSDNELTSETSWFSIEPQHHHHHHAHMTVKEYQSGNTRNIGLASNSIPQMHHV